MHSILKSLRFCSVLLALAQLASGTEYTVSSSVDDGSAGTLRSLIANAASGDKITIPEGLSVEINSRIPITNAIQLSLVGAGSGATLYGNRSSASLTNGLFYINHAAANLTFDNLTITNGFAKGSGGAFFINNCSNATTFVRCRFLSNQSGASGGAMYLMQKINLNDCAFTNNTAATYGGCFDLTMDNAYAQNITRSGVLVSTNCSFFGNIAGNGGGVVTTAEHSRWVALDINGWTCVSNSAAQGGCFNLNTTNLIQNCLFEGNSITGSLGSVANIFRGTRTVFKGCTFKNNKTTNTGAIVTRTSVSILDCVFDGNINAGGAGFDVWRENGTLYAYLDFSAGTVVVSNSVFKNELSRYIVTSSGTTAYQAFLTDCSFLDPTGMATAVTLAHAGNIERCFFGIGNVNPSRDTVLLSLTAPTGLTNTVANCTFSRNPATAYGNKRKALNIGSTNGVYKVSFCSLVGFAGSEGAVKLSSTTASSTQFRGCVFAENGQRTSGVLTTPIDIYNAVLGVENCCFMAPESKLTIVSGGTTANNLFSTDPKLQALADNDGLLLPDGSHLQTYAFLPTQSPLRNAGGTLAIASTDARGLPRPDRVSNLADIGAYEYQPTVWGTLIKVQ